MAIALDIGVVIYSIESKSTLKAVWYSTGLKTPEQGTGVAVGDTSGGFEGSYKIKYYDGSGSEMGTFDLTIVKSGQIFELSWKVGEKVLFVGVGIESKNSLSAGWRKN